MGRRRRADRTRASLSALLVTVVLATGCSSVVAAKAAPRFSSIGASTLLVGPQPGNEYGFEGGQILEVQGKLWWFTTELTGDPYWGKTTLAAWSSTDDGQSWQRVAALFGPSSADLSGTDRRSALWAPMPVFDHSANRWRLFYIGYRSMPSSVNYDGEVWEATSTVAGMKGIAGPYTDNGVVLSEEMGTPQGWEAHQGDDSFEPYQLPDGSWVALYGSSDSATHWNVGLASAPNLSGPWTRDPGNPLALSSTIENPVVEKIGSGFVAVYDDVNTTTSAGCMYSSDASTWQTCTEIPTVSRSRTPLGLLHIPGESGNQFTLFYTACSGQVCSLYSEPTKL